MLENTWYNNSFPFQPSTWRCFPQFFLRILILSNVYSCSFLIYVVLYPLTPKIRKLEPFRRMGSSFTGLRNSNSKPFQLTIDNRIWENTWLEHKLRRDDIIERRHAPHYHLRIFHPVDTFNRIWPNKKRLDVFLILGVN